MYPHMSREWKKLPQHTTSKGVAKFCYLNKPNDKYKAEGEYSVQFTQTPEEAKPLVALIDAAMAESLKDAKAEFPKKKQIKQADAPYKKDTDQDGNETGLLSFKFKAVASGIRKEDKTPWTFRPMLFDAKGGKIPATVQIWGGSVVRVSFEISPFYTEKVGAGVSLRMKAVKVLELRTGKGRDANAYGFGEAEEGYEAAGEEGLHSDSAGASGNGSEAGENQDF